MQGTNITNIARLGAAVLALGCVSGPVMARTDGVVPVPPAKPAQQNSPFREPPLRRRRNSLPPSRQQSRVSPVAFWALRPPRSRLRNRPRAKRLNLSFIRTKPMSDADARTYQAIFDYQEDGKIEAADRQIARSMTAA
jgi:hypothetical protein